MAEESLAQIERNGYPEKFDFAGCIYRFGLPLTARGGICDNGVRSWKGRIEMTVNGMIGAALLAPAVGFAAVGPQTVLELPPGPGNPRNSEGDFAVLKDGSVLFAYSHYNKDGGSDNSPAYIASRISHDGGRTWSKESREIVPNEGGMNVMCASFLRLKDGSLALFYDLKNSVEDCRPVMRVSRDEGKTWSAPVKCVPDSEVGYYVFENCRAERLSSGRIILPLSYHEAKDGKTSDGYGKLVCWFSDDEGRTWRRGAAPFAAYDASGNRLTLQEPGIVELKDGRVLMYARTTHGRQWFFYSSDRGETWSEGRPSQLIGPCSPATLKRLRNGDILAVWNDHADYPEYAARDGSGGKRNPMSVAVSSDEGVSWRHRRVVEDLRHEGQNLCYFGVLEQKDDLLIGYCATNWLNPLRIKSVPRDWIYAGGADSGPRRGFFGIREGDFKWLSTGAGVWSAKPGSADVYAWPRGKGVRLWGWCKACLELPVGGRLEDLRLFVERASSERKYGFAVEGRLADGTWRELFVQGEDTPTGRLLPIVLKDAPDGVTALRFSCLTDGDAYITD